MILAVGAGLPRRYTAAAERMGCEVVQLPPCPALPRPLASHADLLICPMGERIYTFRDYYQTAAAELDHIAATGGCSISFLEALPGDSYPQDVPLCIRQVGRHVIIDQHTAPELCRAATAAGLIPIYTRQGYTACSTLAVGDGIITADRGIKKAAEAARLSVLGIKPGGILLPGYDYGFIGGTCGVCPERGEVWFAGDPLTHPDGAEITAFIEHRGYCTVPLSDGPLFDCGGMFFFDPTRSVMIKDQ